MKGFKQMNRKQELLRLCLELLQRCDKSDYLIDIMSQEIFYDGVMCDTHCLIEDIKIELESED